MLKIVGISDLHGYLPDNIPTCNILCISGDIIPLRIQKNSFASIKWWLKDFCSWASRLPCEKVIFTAGNHDYILEQLFRGKLYYKFIAMLEQYSSNKAILLINEKYSYKGVTFYGFPYIRPIYFQERKWAFEDNYKSIEDIGEYSILNNLQTDVLLTHDNPFKNKILYKYVQNNPKIWFYGHWHEGEDNRGLKQYNCSILNNTYSIKENFDIPTVDIEEHENVSETEDDIPLPITGNIIKEEYAEDDY